MPKITLKAWKPGLKKVSLSRLLQELAGLSLKESKEQVDRLLNGESVAITIVSSHIAEEFVQRANELGAIGEIETPL